ncbi:MAG TPA: hypothetical protein VEQ63_04885 [Bryobacteraceae bacterium]|nr:hypothetical protein [Bryobacteraceae bacterium]
MPSSTSSSEAAAPSVARAGKREIAVVLALLALLYTSFELATRFGVARLSKITSRVEAERRQTMQVKNGQKAELLILGNSLLEAAIQIPKVKEALAPDWNVTRYVVEQTSYLDWYYGMRKILDAGARPDVVALSLTARNITTSAVRGDYFAYYLMQPSDLPDIQSRLRLHPTEASNYLFSNISQFYGLKSEIRKVVLGRLMRDMSKLTPVLTRVTRPPLYEADVRSIALRRLQDCKEVAEAHGARFVLLVPPVQANDYTDTLLEVGASIGVPVIAPRPPGLSSQHYTDGYHLGPVGAGMYTEELLGPLRQILASWHTEVRRAAATK